MVKPPPARKTPSTKATAEPLTESISFAHARAWAEWLATHHASSRGTWLKIAKKGSLVASITYAEALEVALCWGWIDGQKAALDGSFWLQRFTPRRPKSIWSKVNCAKALALIATGEMKPPGQIQVERAKSDGRWEAAYDSPSRATVPPDLAGALVANAEASRFFDTLNSQNRYAVLFRIHTAKKAETRAARIVKLIEMLARGEKLYP